MTAKVAVINKSAVALAADSAVTTGEHAGQKVYNTANKLFALSKYRPVGLMVYGNSQFMAVPWETIIKLYRSKLQRTSFAHLIQYADHFLSFLEQEHEVLWPSPIQEQYFFETATAYFQLILEQINREVSKSLSAGHSLSEQEIAALVSATVNWHREKWDQRPLLPGIPDGHSADIAAAYYEKTQRAIKEVFQALPLEGTALSDLQAIAAQLFCKQEFPVNTSGLVVAGFGEQEIFPSVASFALEAVIRGTLKYHQAGVVTASRDNQAFIMPFAQREMVQTFMEGIDPSFREAVSAYLQELVTNYPRQILEAIPEILPEKRQVLATNLGQIAAQVLQDFSCRIKSYVHGRHVQPVLSAVAALPKDELAAMAEALVNLTSFKRKVTLEAETVGGPIDVAVISKGDGFIWIKRKHYFEPTLNQSFFANYYREDADG